MMRLRLIPLLAFGLLAACAASEDEKASSSSAAATTTTPAVTNALRIPLLAEDLKTEATSKMSAYNTQLATESIAPIPDFLDVSDEASASHYSDLREQFSDAASKLNLTVQDFTRGIDPAGYADAGNPICYLGDPHSVVDLIMTSADLIFSDQIGIHGWRYKAEKHAVDDDPDTDLADDLPDEWKNWKGTDESVLVLTHVGDDGDDVAAAIISPCAK